MVRVVSGRVARGISRHGWTGFSVRRGDGALREAQDRDGVRVPRRLLFAKVDGVWGCLLPLWWGEAPTMPASSGGCVYTSVRVISRASTGISLFACGSTASMASSRAMAPSRFCSPSSPKETDVGNSFPSSRITVLPLVRSKRLPSASSGQGWDSCLRGGDAVGNGGWAVREL